MKPNNRRMRTTTTWLIAFLVVAGGAWSAGAGPHDDAWLAYQSGDTTKAIDILVPLASQGDSSAQNNLGVIYSRGEFGDGRGVPQNYAEALKWFSLAAQKGVPDAYFNLGHLHYYGRGIPQDYVKAVDWLDMANSAGHPRAAKLRDEVLSKMSPAQRAEVEKLVKDDRSNDRQSRTYGRQTPTP